MQRAITLITAFVLILALTLNIVLYLQNTSLRARLAGQPAAQATSPAQADEVARLKQQLETSEEGRRKALGDVTTLRNQLTILQGASEQLTEAKRQIESLQQENQQLHNEINNLQGMNQINGQVAAVRSLSPLHNVPRKIMNQRELRDYLVESINREYSAEDEQRDRSIGQALDMGVADNPRAEQVDDLVKNLLGFYDQRTKELVVITNRSTMGVRDRITYAHEFTHSMQDQHYDLTALMARAEGNSDYSTAIRALIEGDATLTMSLYARENLNAMDMAAYQIEQAESLDLSNLFTGRAGPLVESAAAFPYQEGAYFAGTLHHNGGWAAVDQAFKNPPRSTEQVIHPEKYVAGEQPVAVKLPNLAATLGPGWRVVTEDTLGELYTRIYLEAHVPFDQAVAAGTGWGGDRYQVLEDGKGHVTLALLTAWDTPQDTEEFFNAYRVFAVNVGGGSTNVLATTPNSIHWGLGGRQILLSRTGNRVLVLHALAGAQIDALRAAIPGF